MTPEEYQTYLIEYRRKMGLENNPTATDTPDLGFESTLQGKIQKYCKDHGYPNQ